MKRAIVIGATFSAMAFLAGGCGSSSHATSLPGLTPARLAKIRADVRAMTANFNHAHPSSVMVYASQRQQARIALGARAGVPGSQPVYLVVLRGHFIGPHPAGGDAAVLETNAISMILDRTTLQRLYTSFGGHVDTSTVGAGLRLAHG